MTFDQAAFDAGLDEYQATLAEAAADAAERSYEAASRPDAEPVEVTFADLREGDYMTNEGPRGRWVRVAEVRGPCSYVKRRIQKVADDEVSILFEIPEAVTVSGERRYWIERKATERVLIDARCRAANSQAQSASRATEREATLPQTETD